MARKVILCVDDERIILTSLKSLFSRSLGNEYRFEMAESAQEAIDLVDELVSEGSQVLAIVSDWLMPNMKGDELLTLVHDRYPEIATFLITGQADEESLARAKRDAGIERCFRKPWDDDELIAAIKATLS